MELDPTVGIVGGVVAITEVYGKGATSFETWRKGRKTRKSAEEELQTSLDVSGQAVEWEYRKLEEKYGDAFKHGDGECVEGPALLNGRWTDQMKDAAKTTLESIAKQLNREVIDVLVKIATAPRQKTEMEPVDLWKKSEEARSAARRVMFDLCQRLDSQARANRPRAQSTQALGSTQDIPPSRIAVTRPEYYTPGTAASVMRHSADFGRRSYATRQSHGFPQSEERETFGGYNHGTTAPVAPPRRDYVFPPVQNSQILEDVPPRRNYTSAQAEERQQLDNIPPRQDYMVSPVEKRQTFEDEPPRRDYMFPPVENRQTLEDAPLRRDYVFPPVEQRQSFEDEPPRRDYVFPPVENRQTFEDAPPRRDYRFHPAEESQTFGRYTHGAAATSALGDSHYVDDRSPRQDHMVSPPQERVRMPRIHPRFSRAPSPQVSSATIPERTRSEPEPLPSTPHSLVPGGQLYTSQPARLSSPAPPPKTLSISKPPRLPSPAPPPKTPLPATQPPFASQLSPQNFTFLPQCPPPPPKTAAEVLREAEWEEASRWSATNSNPRYSVGPPGPPRPPKPPSKQLASHQRNASAPPSTLLKTANEGKRADMEDEVGHEYMIPPEREWGGGEPW
ncbi:hypothetical protein BJ875DRAFT_481742 [Amylocarpus encephaloides]|uniref:Uncharacterized protein n=1 Tax=Amylocarpus encephaloides TaxID=45428 RepID=A0A9P7YPH6_9HELO|nr:hypothetical protein BJ875DRAFT_481742 [Amylocarpus encephaloides]